MKQLNASDERFDADLACLLEGEEAGNRQVVEVVDKIIQQVREQGDSAIIELTSQFDRFQVSDFDELIITTARRQQALKDISPEIKAALEQAAARIRDYAQHQKIQSWQYEEADGTVLGQQVTPLDSVGIYVPGGTAAYPSSVLMNAIPATVAGVPRIVMVVPTPDGILNDMVLAAAEIAGVDEIYRIGGAQAVAALAYGTSSLAPVDKIVGPGNIYVATAKRQVFGKVGIDMIAGPSEILVVCDGSTDPDWIAMDLFSQAEHDVLAQSILVSIDSEFLDRVSKSIEALLADMPRRDIIKQSLEDRGAMILVNNLDEAVDIINRIAPEHLELSVKDPDALLPKIRHAGAIFMGAYSTEVLGDYCAGPNHVLPTSRTARFSSPLGVYDFQKRSSVINFSIQGAQRLADIASTLARGEGLVAHARAAEMRIKK